MIESWRAPDLNSGLTPWRFHVMALVGDGESGRWVGLSGGSRSLGMCPGKMYLDPALFSFFASQPPWGWATKYYLRLPAMMCCLTTGQKQWSQLTMDRNLWNCEPNQIFPLFTLFLSSNSNKKESNASMLLNARSGCILAVWPLSLSISICEARTVFPYRIIKKIKWRKGNYEDKEYAYYNTWPRSRTSKMVVIISSGTDP
jgi:hypothetical protein